MISSYVGLSSSAVADLQKTFGQNVLPKKVPPRKIWILFQQFKSPLVYVLFFALIVTLVIGDFADASIIFLAVFLNTILGYVQENKATNALLALNKFVTEMSTVVRDGKRQKIKSSELVVGDIVILSQGDKIPADGKLIFSNRTFLDEAILTGESVTVSKKQNDQVFMGTVVSSGQAIMIVESIGGSTKIGQIASQIQSISHDSPLQNQMKHFSRQLVLIIGIILFFVLIFGLAHNYQPSEIFITAVALAVSSIPEGLLVSLTVVLAIGMQKILRQKGLVRKLSSAETLGGVSIICVDKTGTLTEGKMEVVDYIGPKTILAKQVLIANDLDDPIVISAHRWGKEVLPDFKISTTRIDSIPFSSIEKFFISLNSYSRRQNIIYVNGAPEVILEWTTLSKSDKKTIFENINQLTSQGKRVVGFAQKTVPLNKKTLTVSDAKKDLQWIGLLAFTDPVRKNVKSTLEKTAQAGIKTIVITGDYAATTLHILKELGIFLSPSQIMTGADLDKLNQSELSKKIDQIYLFARTSPTQKLQIVKALQSRGHVVAMMGDGVNDAPALHSADIGIAVNEATDVAKESADIILLDSNFATVVSAIEEGRGMFDNIRKIILYLLSDSFAEIMVVFGSIVMDLPLPVTAIQILWINLVSDGFPDLALTVDPKRSGLMLDRPRSKSEKLINRWMIIMIGIISLLSGILALSAFILTLNLTGDIIVAQSVTFIVLGLNSLNYVFSIRTLNSPFWENKIFENKYLVVGVVAGFILQLLPFSTSTTQQFFGVTSLPIFYWLYAISISLFMFLVVEIIKIFFVKNQKS